MVDRGFESQWVQTEHYDIGICPLSAKHAAVRKKRKDWMAQNRMKCDRVGEHDYSWTVFSLSWHYKNPTKRVGVVQSGPHYHITDN